MASATEPLICGGRGRPADPPRIGGADAGTATTDGGCCAGICTTDPEGVDGADPAGSANPLGIGTAGMSAMLTWLVDLEVPRATAHRTRTDCYRTHNRT